MSIAARNYAHGGRKPSHRIAKSLAGSLRFGRDRFGFKAHLAYVVHDIVQLSERVGR